MPTDISISGSMSCVDYFARELSYIYDEKIRDTARQILAAAPDYFLKIPSSTTGKYHPQDEIVPGGKALHVKRVVYLVRELCVMESMPPKDHDLLVAAALIHDLFFKDWPEKEHSVNNHPELLRQYTKEKLGKLPYYEKIMFIAEKHSGRWSVSPENKPKQKIKSDKLLHIADYVASRRPIHIEVFDATGANFGLKR